METFATPANFLSETAALLVESVFTLEKRDRRSLEHRGARRARGVGAPRGETKAGWKPGQGMVTAAEGGRIQRLFLFSGNLLPARI